MLQMYKGQIPDKQAIKEISKEIQMPRRTVYKWFWDRVNQTKKRESKNRKNDKSMKLQPSTLVVALSKFSKAYSCCKEKEKVDEIVAP